MLEQIQVCTELGIQCVECNPDNRPFTKDIIKKLGKLIIMDGPIEIGVSCTPTSTEISHDQEEGSGDHHAKLTDVYENIGPAKTETEVKVPLYRNPDEGESSRARVTSSPDQAYKHHVPDMDTTDTCSDDPNIAPSSLEIIYKMISPVVRWLPRVLGLGGLQSLDFKIKVSINCGKCRSCIMQIVANIKGIKSMTSNGDESVLTVVGDYDAAVLVAALQEMKHPVHIISLCNEIEDESLLRLGVGVAAAAIFTVYLSL